MAQQKGPAQGHCERASIPSEVYDAVLRAVAVTPAEQRFRSIAAFVLDQALKQLALRSSASLRLLVLRCLMRDQRVTCLYPAFGLGIAELRVSSPLNLELHGVESLAGYTALLRHSFVSQDSQLNPEHLPIRQESLIKSIAVFPLLQESRVAGCFQACSSQQGYFSSNRLGLLGGYANLLALAFPTHEFYDIQQIALDLMPDYQTQQPRIGSFRRRVNALLRASMVQQRSLNLLQAENLVLQDLARELSEQ